MTIPAKLKQRTVLDEALASAAACRLTAELLARNMHIDTAAGAAVAPVLRMAMMEEERARRIRAAGGGP